MSVLDFVEQWDKDSVEDNGEDGDDDDDDDDDGKSVLYLKDWHFVKVHTYLRLTHTLSCENIEFSRV